MSMEIAVEDKGQLHATGADTVCTILSGSRVVRNSVPGAPFELPQTCSGSFPNLRGPTLLLTTHPRFSTMQELSSLFGEGGAGLDFARQILSTVRHA